MNKYIFEFQTKFQALYTFNLLDIRYFRFDDNKKELLLNFGDYNHYYLEEYNYILLKENLTNLAKDLNYLIDGDRYIFTDHISGLRMDASGYFVMFKLVNGFYRVSKKNYFILLDQFINK